MRDLRRHGLERTFAHQFRVMATRQPEPLAAPSCERWKSGGKRDPWRSFTRLRRRKHGLAAAKHAEREKRRRELTEAWLYRRHLVRELARERSDENEIKPLLPTRRGAMSRWELYHWHRQNGTLAVFNAMFSPR